MLTRERALEQLTGPGGSFELTRDDSAGQPPLRVYGGAPDTLRQVLCASRQFGQNEFLIFADERISYEEHFLRVARLAHWLVDKGVAKGDRVGICMRNYPEWSISFFACQALGAVAVTLNAWWTGHELVYGIKDSGCSVAVLDDERYARLHPELHEFSNLEVLLVRDHERRYNVAHWDDALRAHEHVSELPAAEIAAQDVATIMYTSGTTGFPKGALHTQRNHITNIQNTLLGGAVVLAQLAQPPTDSPSPSSLQTFPLFHIGGLSGLYITLVSGGKLVLMYRWDPEQALELIEREQVRSWAAVPTLVRQLLEHSKAGGSALNTLVSIASGGAPVPADLINHIGERFQRRVAPGNGYGATETTSAIISNSGADYLARPQSVGRPVATVDVRIVDDAGNGCDTGVIGELWVRGPNIFSGYWNKPQETASSFNEGWFKTGDLGYVDEEGFYYVVDRKKDVIIRGGENVYCAEVEGVLHGHPDIIDVALIGLPHRVLGEEVAAVVERKPGSRLSELDVQELVKSKLAHYNVPSRVFFISEPLPRTATGKILKRDLKQRYGG